MTRLLPLLGLVLAVQSPVFAETVYVTDKVFIDLRADAHYESPVVHKLLTGTTLEVLSRDGDFTRVRDAHGREGWIENRELTRQPPARLRQVELQHELAAVREELGKTQSQLEQAQTVLAEDNATERAMAKAQAKLKRQLAEARAKLARTQAELKESQAALAQETAKTAELSEQLAAETQALDKTDSPARAETHVEARLDDQPEPSDPIRQTSEYPGSGDEPLPELMTEAKAIERFLNFLRSLDFLWIGISFAMLVIGFVAGVLWLRGVNRRKLGGMYLRI